MHARECAGFSLSEELRSEGAMLKLNGLELREATIFKVDVYVAALYVTQTSRDAGPVLNSNTPKELVSTSLATWIVPTGTRSGRRASRRTRRARFLRSGNVSRRSRL